jgi:hypothetical protein
LDSSRVYSLLRLHQNHSLLLVRHEAVIKIIVTAITAIVVVVASVMIVLNVRLKVQ